MFTSAAGTITSADEQQHFQSKPEEKTDAVDPPAYDATDVLPNDYTSLNDELRELKCTFESRSKAAERRTRFKLHIARQSGQSMHSGLPSTRA
jgi:hypothetical protein